MDCLLCSDAGMAEATGMTESENGDDSDSSDEGLGIPDATEDGTQDGSYEEPSETPEETDSARKNISFMQICQIWILRHLISSLWIRNA